VVLTAALIPLTVGMVVRVSFSALAARIEKPATVMAKVLLPLAVLALLAIAWPAVWAAVGDGTVIAIVAFTTAGLLAGHVMGAPDRDHSIVLALSTACRHPAIAFLIATSNFPDERVGGTILLYLLVSALVGAVYVAAQRHRLAATRVTAVRS
jgi:BASS family bile acid:Na+ symporter